MQNFEEAQKLIKSKNYKKALSFFENALKENPNQALTYQGIAQCQYDLGKYKEAIDASKKALMIEPRLIMPHTILAFIYGRTQNLVEGHKEAVVALGLDPNSFEALNCYGTILLAEGRYDEAASFLYKATEINPNSFATHQNLAIAYEKKADLRRYLEETKIVFRLRPSIQNGLLYFLA